MAQSTQPVSKERHQSLKWWPLCAGVLLFLGASAALLPYPGLQSDEVLFAHALYAPVGTGAWMPLGAHRLPLMALPYLGSLKTWLYVPLLAVVRPSIGSIRVPAVLLAALTIWLCFLFAREAAGWRPAAAVALLLGTDTAYLLTSCFDWGPVVLQHLFLAGTLLLGLRFHRTGALGPLAGCAFCAGLGMWDKAVFIWVLSGVIAAVILVFPRELARHAGWRALAVAAGAFTLGASPLWWFNIVHNGETFRDNARFRGTGELPARVAMLRMTWDGSALFGYLANQGGPPHMPATALERISARLHDAARDRTRNRMTEAMLAALLALSVLLFTSARRILLFCLIACALAWLEMAFAKGQAGRTHHVVLLWPLPHLFLAVVLSRICSSIPRVGGWVFGMAVAFLVGTNLLVANQYLYRLSRFGAAGSWTDAIFPLSEGLRKIPARTIYVADWGILDPLEVLHRGRLPLAVGSDPFLRDMPGEEAEREAVAMFSAPDALWVRHTAGNEQFVGINARLDRAAARAGFEERLTATYRDRNGRPVFEALRLIPSRK